MLRTRIIPVLLLNDKSLVKTIKFNKYEYIGDPVNTCRIFNELEVDELCFLDIAASKQGKEPNFDILKEISNECFMPLSYGGGVQSLAIAEKIFKIGFEKIVLNSAIFTKPNLIKEIGEIYGTQSIVAAVDVKKNMWGKYQVFGLNGTINYKKSPLEWIMELEQFGVGEILLTNIDREGTWKGYDLDLLRSVTEITNLPVICHGGAGSIKDISDAIKIGKASAVALGSMVVYQKKDMGVLVNFPDKDMLDLVLI